MTLKIMQPKRIHIFQSATLSAKLCSGEKNLEDNQIMLINHSSSPDELFRRSYRTARPLWPAVLVAAMLALLLPSGSWGQQSQLYELLSPTQTGVTFANRINETKEFNIQEFIYAYNGGGVGVGDINNDGLPDLFFTAMQLQNKLYINKGNFKFEDITHQAGLVENDGISFGVSMVDINADGWMDIYVCRQDGPNRLYINNGDLTFTERAKDFGLAYSPSSTHSAFFDYDRDGDLDAYILVNGDARGDNYTRKGLTDRLFRNNGNNTFTDVSAEAGINDRGYGLGLGVGDLNDDQWPDLFITNDFEERDIIYINNKNGTFTNSTKSVTKHTTEFGMGNDIADFDNDGHLDIVAVDMLPEDHKRLHGHMGSQSVYSPLFDSTQLMRNILLHNRGNGTFADIAFLSGIAETDWSWACLLEDLDNDGFKDLYVANGYKRDVSNLDVINNFSRTMMDKVSAVKLVPTTRLQNYVFRNNGNLTFSKITDQWGFSQVVNTNGAAFADLDRDGDLDLVLNNLDSAAYIYRSNAVEHHVGNYLRIKLNGKTPNAEGIGARIDLWANGGHQVREAYRTRGYLSSVEPIPHFGIGKATTVDSVRVIWSDGTEQTLRNVAANQVLALNQSESGKSTPQAKPQVPALFTEITTENGLHFNHRENIKWDDFERERLLPNRLSRNGPGIAVGDINGDNREDVFVGGGKFQPGKIFIQLGEGKFQQLQQPSIASDSMSEDMGALFFDADGDNDLDLYVVSGGNEYKADSPELQDRLYLNDGKGNFKKNADALPQMLTSSSSVIAADYDGDNDLDLFVAGRCIPGQYPLNPRSYLLNNTKGKFSDVTAKIAAELDTVGMVTSAIWSDYDNDNDPDILLVGEWMTPRVFRNDKGKFKDATANSGLENEKGWWNSIISGDFDNDGDMDYIAGNLGLNTSLRMKASKEHPIRLYANDFDDNGSLDLVTSYYYRGIEYPTRGRQTMASQMPPFIRRKFPTYAAYAAASIQEIFDKKKLDAAIRLEATNMASSYIENVGNGEFKISQLPIEAQVSPTFGMIIQDFNADGNLDLALVGNFYAPSQDVVRYDAGSGLVLQGDGKGNFTPLTPTQSGLFANDDARGITALQQSGTNSLAMIVVNNNAPSQIFERQFSSTDGKLMGFEDIAKYTHLILKLEDGRQRRYECSYGSGYLSQCSGAILITPQTQSVTLFKGTKQIKQINF